MAKKKKQEETQNLTQSELLQVETNQFEIRIKTKELELAQRNVDYCKTELTLLSANYTLKLREKTELSSEETRTKKELENLKNRQKKFNAEISEKYELKQDKWGYDIHTGEIK